MIICDKVPGLYPGTKQIAALPGCQGRRFFDVTAGGEERVIRVPQEKAKLYKTCESCWRGGGGLKGILPFFFLGRQFIAIIFEPRVWHLVGPELSTAEHSSDIHPLPSSKIYVRGSITCQA